MGHKGDVESQTMTAVMQKNTNLNYSVGRFTLRQYSCIEKIFSWQACLGHWRCSFVVDRYILLHV
jgi:hypothetical protein